MTLKKLFLFSIILGGFFTSNACDVCGGGGAGSYFGIIPNFTKNLIGYRFQSQHLEYLNNDFNLNGESQVQEDYFFRNELWSRYYPTKRIQVITFLPYQINYRKESLRTTLISGIGDINVQGLYTIYNFGDSTKIKHKHTWLLGGGVKLPTAKYQQRDETKAMLPELFQIGVGAYGLGLQNIYVYRFKNFGVNTDLQFRYNLENELGFRLGNQFTSNVSLFYWKKIGKYSLLPSAGVLFEYYDANQRFSNNLAQTGGNSILGKLGFDIYYGSFIFQFFGFAVINQDLEAAMPQNNWRLGFGIAKFLKNSK